MYNNKNYCNLTIWEIVKRERMIYMSQTVWSLVPPVVTIILALATKEVYMSLDIGIIIRDIKLTSFNILFLIVFFFFF